jgi:hypothetical protein
LIYETTPAVGSIQNIARMAPKAQCSSMALLLTSNNYSFEHYLYPDIIIQRYNTSTIRLFAHKLLNHAPIPISTPSLASLTNISPFIVLNK